MKRSRCMGTAAGVIGALLLAFTYGGCGGDDGYARAPDTAGGGDTSDTGAASELRRRHRSSTRPTPPPSQPAPAPSPGSGAGTEDVIAAAQTPDGRALPQAAGPNGACPEVVVRLGFWSCPTINETCSSPTRHCTCSRTDGEGQFPTWVCQ
jgi:hypothetical protein